MEGTLSCPFPYTYVAAQLDVQTTIQNMDPMAQEAARTIQPAKCLLYLYELRRYPLPGTPTPFEAYIVGPGLRAEDPANGFTADMCIPIFPTTAHPNSRPAVLPNRRFPFSNCYHWAYVDVLLRVAGGEFPGSGDSPRLVRLGAGEQARMDRLVTKDLTAAILAKRARRKSSPRTDYDSDEDAFNRTQKVPEALLPIVNVSVDLSESLDETDLPDPMEFLRQYNALIRLARESNERQEAAVGDDVISLSTMHSENDHSILRRDRGEGRPGKLPWFSRALMRTLRVGQAKEQHDRHREVDLEGGNGRRDLMYEGSETPIMEPETKDTNKFRRRVFRVIRTFFQLR